MKRRQQPETVVTNAIVQKLAIYGYHVKKVYNGGVPAGCSGGQVRYKKKEAEFKGIPDLLAYNPRRKHFMFIEVKSKKKKGSPEQEEFIESFSRCDIFEAFICWDENILEDKLKEVEKQYVKKRSRNKPKASIAERFDEL